MKSNNIDNPKDESLHKNNDNAFFVLMIGTERELFKENSESRQRIVEYGSIVKELHIIVFRKYDANNTNIMPIMRIANNIFVYLTNSRCKWFYIFDAIKIGKKIIRNLDLEIKNSRDKILVTSQDPFECGLAGYFLAKKFKIPLQLQIHTDFLNPYFVQHSILNKLRVVMAKFLIYRANCIRVVSNRIKESLKAKSYKLKAEPIVLPIFIDIGKIKNAPIKTNLHKKYPQFDFIILMASRLTKEKNIGLAIRATVDIVKQYPKTGLIIVGSGPEEKKLKAISYKLKANIIFESWTDDLVSYYKTADLFLLTSNYEGYGRTLVEAASAGCKIISSNVGVTKEILPQENIFESNNREQLKEKIIQAIKGEVKLSKALPQQIKEQYLQEYKKSWGKCL